jgi:hypothetical protein
MLKLDVGFAWAGSIMSILFFATVNYLTSSHQIWFIYPSFILLLWPVSLHYLRKGDYKIHSIFCSIWIIIFLITINYLYSPSHPWFLYASYPIIWWPILMYSVQKRKTVSLAIIGSLLTIMYYSILNATLSHQYPWAIYPSFVVLWWPIVLHCVKTKKYFHLSLWASVLSIVFFIVVNKVSTPSIIWAIYPIFVILWWPLSMYYFILRRKILKSKLDEAIEQ